MSFSKVGEGAANADALANRNNPAMNQCERIEPTRPFSPLTPALSPLRGEGEPPSAEAIASNSLASGRTELSARESGSGDAMVRADARHSPSPLNGERAGVSGEDGLLCPEYKLFKG